jgi:probable rRNA maturation factor
MNPGIKLGFYNSGSQYRIREKQRIRKVALWLLRNEGFSGADINIILVTDAILHDYNLKYLNHDTFTDVITFDYTEKGSRQIQGEIYISIDRIGENARAFKVSKSKELLRVIFHGILHLCRYKDKTRAQRLEMTAMEDECLKKFETFKKRD